MQKIPLSSATGEMILACDVYRDNVPVGFPIFKKETVLTDDLIKRLESLNVQAIYVKCRPIEKHDSPALDTLLQNLDARFVKTLQEPLNAMLYEIYKAYLIKSMGGNCG